MGMHEVIRRYYEDTDEAGRLWDRARGELTRLRTWDLFGRFIPPASRIADVGGGPGTHAAHLAGQGHDVALIDPVPRHVEAAAAAGVDALLGEARVLPFDEQSFDVVLLMGPLYHLFDREERVAALREARRVLRPGGRLLAEVITRHVWIVDASLKGLLGDRDVWENFDLNLRTGWSNDPDRVRDGVFWGYFHGAGELDAEVDDAGFDLDATLAVEGYAWMLGNLAHLLDRPDELIRAVRLTEAEPSMLGASAHVMGVAERPPG